MEKNGFCDEGCGTELTFWGFVFVLYLFLSNLLLNMQLSLDSNFFRENLLNKKFLDKLFLAILLLNMQLTLDS